MAPSNPKAMTPRTAILVQSSLGRQVWVQNGRVAPFIQKPWNTEQKEHLLRTLAKTLEIRLTSRGFVQACTRMEGAEKDPTNYDAVWVRDTVWVYLALKAEGKRKDAATLMSALLEYFSTPAQLQRLEKVIQNPACIQGPGGPMEVIHIRFDGASDGLEDVEANGEPQFWNHKQNDALGIFYSAAIEALSSELVSPSSLAASTWRFLLRLPTYFERIDFSDMADAGAWEELERINTSSVALVTDALEKWRAALKQPAMAQALNAASQSIGLDWTQEVLGNPSRLDALIEKGYARIHKQLPFESPSHPTNGLQYRKADAALLNLLTPCSLERLSTEDLLSVLHTVETLCGPRGVRRYFNDAYQSGNYWLSDQAAAGLQESGPEGTAPWTDDCSAPEDFQRRTSHMIAGTEAQWFFDSWISLGIGQLLLRSDISEGQRQELSEKRLHYLHRALGQITGGTESHPEIGADGKQVPGSACPESYNTVISPDGIRRFAPSPITPLNWAKASLRLALQHID